MNVFRIGVALPVRNEETTTFAASGLPLTLTCACSKAIKSRRMNEVLSKAIIAARSAAASFTERLAKCAHGEADSGEFRMDWRSLITAWPHVAKFLVKHASHIEKGVVTALVLWYRTRWGALFRSLIVVGIAKWTRLYGQTVTSGKDKLSCAVRLQGGYSLAQMLVKFQGYCDLHVPVFGRFQLHCQFNSLDRHSTKKKATDESLESSTEIIPTICENEEECNAPPIESEKPRVELPVIQLENHTDGIETSSMYADRDEGLCKNALDLEDGNRRQTCDLDDLQALFHGISHDEETSSDIDSEAEDKMAEKEEDYEKNGNSIPLSNICKKDGDSIVTDIEAVKNEADAAIDKENSNILLSPEALVHKKTLDGPQPTPFASKTKNSFWTPRTTAATIAKSSAVDSSINETAILSGLIAVKAEKTQKESTFKNQASDSPQAIDKALGLKRSKHSKRKRRRRRGGDSLIYRASSMGSASLLD